MMGLLVVSHSLKLAEGVKELVTELSSNKVVVEAVGGKETLGVNAVMVKEGLDRLFSLGVEQVLIFGDLGSAFIAAETAIEIEGLSDRVAVVDAPMVEGAVAAAMMLSIGRGATEAISEAENAYSIRKR